MALKHVNQMNADECLTQLDHLTERLRELGNDDPQVNEAIKHLRTTIGFEMGGYVGQTNLCDMVDDGAFNQSDEDE